MMPKCTKHVMPPRSSCVALCRRRPRGRWIVGPSGGPVEGDLAIRQVRTPSMTQLLATTPAKR
eukprot:6458331-Amphidinium_carterae.1